MINKLTWVLFASLLFLLLPCTSVSAQQTADNMVFLGNWDDVTLEPTPDSVSNANRYSDVWGYAANGREYALIGSRKFVHILDVTDPANITELHRLNISLNTQSTWRDIKVLGDYAYCATEGNEGLQVIDMTGLPSVAFVVFDTKEWFNTCHNIIVDSTSTPPRLYAFGTNLRSNGYVALSLANPAVPTLIASVNTTGNYIHDAYAVNDTLYANHGNGGMFVYDVSNAATPIELGRLRNYVEAGYNHSNWRTADGRHVVMCDETQDTGVKIVNVENPLDMEVDALFRSASLAPNVRSLAHNPYVLGDSVVVLSYYGEGIVVYDIQDRENPTKIGFYDTTPNVNRYGGGVWGAYPYLPSGNILASDQRTGLHVLRLGTALPVSYQSWSAESDGKNVMLEWTVASENGNAGWSVEHAMAGGQFAEIAFVGSGRIDNSLIHDNPGIGIHYYRLRQRDFDGSEHLSEVKSVSFSGTERRITAYPNPALSGTQLTFQGLGMDAQWELFDAAGRLVKSGTGRNTEIVGPPGVYVVKVAEEVVDKIVVVR